MEEDRAGFEDANRFGSAAVDKGGDLAVGIHLHKAAPELVAIAYADRPGVIFRVLMAALQQLLEHDRDLLPVGCRQRIKLEGVLADWQLLFVRGSGNR